MSKVKDGWHKVNGIEVYVEGNYIKRGIKMDTNGGTLDGLRKGRILMM